MFRSIGVAYNEVVVALLDAPGSSPNLRRFTWILAGGTTSALVLISFTSLSILWFVYVSALSPQLGSIARTGLLLTLPLPALSVFQSWFQGAILHSRRTRAITEAVVVYLLTNALILTAGVQGGQFLGLYVGLAAMTFSTTIQTTWLWFRSRDVIKTVKNRDAVFLSTLESPISA